MVEEKKWKSRKGCVWGGRGGEGGRREREKDSKSLHAIETGISSSLMGPLYLTLPYHNLLLVIVYVVLFMVWEIKHDNDGDSPFWELAK